MHNVRTVLLSIQSLLGGACNVRCNSLASILSAPHTTEPNNESPLNGQAAALWANQEEFRRVLLERACASGSKA